jgi:uncharacterized protein
MIDINIVSEQMKLNKPILIEGFQGTGLVGTLAAQYIAKKLNMKQVGYFESDDLPPLALMVDGEIKYPIRIFACQKHDVVMVESELPIAPKFAFEIADETVKWAKSNKVSRIIALEGVGGSKQFSGKIYGVATNDKLENELKKDGIKILKNGVVIGVSASLLLKCKAKKMPAVCLMAESMSAFPDGHAAAVIVDHLSNKYGWGIDTKPLKEEADKFEVEMKKIIERAKSIQLGHKAPEEKAIYG